MITKNNFLKHFFLLISFIASPQIFAQQYEPSILVLTPSGITADKALKSEMEKSDKEFRDNQQDRLAHYEKMVSESADRSENIRIIQQKNLEFIRDFQSKHYASFLASDYLAYRFFERFKNVLVYPTTETCSGSADSLKLLATKHQTQFVLNFPSINTFSGKKGKQSKIRVQLYDLEQNKILLDQEFSGNSENPGFEFTCNDGSFECTINNALSQALTTVISLIASNNKTLIREKELAVERKKILEKLFSKEPDGDITSIITTHSDLVPKGYFQGFRNEDKTKFIAFFAIENGKKEDGERNIELIMDNESTPNLKTFVVVGIFYNNKWYIKKEKIIFFEAKDFLSGKKEYFNRLQDWNYFKENTTEINPDFWETYFFKKVADVRLEPDYEKYKESVYKSRERDNKDYIGMYELVADGIKEDKKLARDQFTVNLAQNKLIPFLEKQKLSDPANFSDYSSFRSDYVFIMPKDFSAAICPVNVKDANNQFTLRYFVLIPSTNQVYEWTYFKSLTGQKKFSGSDIVDQMDKISDWNFGFDTYDNAAFWEKYVLLKENGKYTYLK